VATSSSKGADGDLPPADQTPTDGTPTGDAGTGDATAPPARRRGRPRDESADARILAAAASLMLERGAVDVTVDQVAEKAGVGKATVYRRYPSKEVMAAEALNTMFSRQVPVPDTGTFRGDMLAVYRDTIGFARSRRGQSFLRLAAGAACRSRRVADLYRVAYEKRRDVFGVLIDRGVERGELTEDLLDRTLFLDALPALLMFRTVTHQDMPEITDAEHLLEQALSGALPHPA
jgi:AcrR family transcriptional regulator